MSAIDEFQGTGETVLEKENRELKAEAAALRGFIDSLTDLMEALESPKAESEVLQIFEKILENAIRAINARDGSLLIPDDKTDELIFAIVRGESPNDELVGKRIPPGKGVVSWVAENRRAAIVNNAAADERFFSGMDQEIEYKTDSLLAAPLIGGGRVIGVVEVINKKDGKLFTIGNQTLLSVMCRFAGELLFTLVKDIDLTTTFHFRKPV